eukprot:scaffold699_cov385-Prasinococcus_capsulatus_cf.AAC.17
MPRAWLGAPSRSWGTAACTGHIGSHSSSGGRALVGGADGSRTGPTPAPPLTNIYTTTRTATERPQPGRPHRRPSWPALQATTEPAPRKLRPPRPMPRLPARTKTGTDSRRGSLPGRRPRRPSARRSTPAAPPGHAGTSRCGSHHHP